MNYEQKTFEKVIKARRKRESRLRRMRQPMIIKPVWWKRMWNKFKMLWQKGK